MSKRIFTYLVVALVAVMTCGVQKAWADSDNLFALVKDASELKKGDTVVIVNKYASVALSKTQRTNNIGAADVKFLDKSMDTLTISENVQELVLEKSGNYWVFKVGNSSYLCSRDKSSSPSSYLSKKSKIDKYTTALIEISSNGYEATINFKQSSYNYVWCSSDTDTKFFACYTAKANQDIYRVYLYKKTSSQSSSTLTLDGTSATADNSTAIKSLQGKTVNVTVNRSFEGDGGWYTLCLPFALSETDISGQFQGATFEEFTSVTTDDNGNVQLNSKKVNTTKAGVPYLVKPIDGAVITSPTFTGKTIDAGQTTTVTYKANGDGDEYSFIGIYDPTDIGGDCNRFVNAKGDALVKAKEGDSKLKGLRAYFKLPSATATAKMGVEDETSAVSLPTAVAPAKPKGVYGLDGQYLGTDTKALPRGVYVVDGHKQMVK